MPAKAYSIFLGLLVSYKIAFPLHRHTSAVRNSDSNSICETLCHIFGMQDSVRKNANEVHDDNCFRKEGNFFRSLVNLFWEVVLRKCTFKVEVFCRSSLGRLSVFSRWNMAQYKRRKRNGNLKKTHFLTFGVLSRFLGSSLVRPWSLTWRLQRDENLNKQPL